MKRLISLLLVCLMVVPFGAFSTLGISAAEPAELVTDSAKLPVATSAKTVYVSADGDDTADGTEATPVQTFSHAYTLVADGGTIVIMGTVTQATFTAAAHTGKVTVKGADSTAVLNLPGRYILGGDTEITDLKIQASATATMIVTCYYNLLVTETVQTTTGAIVCANSQSGVAYTPKDNTVTLNGGKFSDVILGCRGGLGSGMSASSLNGVDVTLNLGGNVVLEKVFATTRSSGSFAEGTVIPNSSATVNINGGQIIYYVCQTDNKTNSIGRSEGLIVNIGKDFDFANSFTATAGTDHYNDERIFIGISGETVYEALSANRINKSKVVLATEIYDSLAASSRFRDVTVEKASDITPEPPVVSNGTVYVSDAGDDANTGADAANALKTLAKAYDLIGDEGNIIISGTYTQAEANFTAPEHTGVITISGDGEGATFVVPANGRFFFGGDTVFDNMHVSLAKNTFLFNGLFNDATFTDTFTSDANMYYVAGVNAGGSAATASDFTVTINGGNFAEVVGIARNSGSMSLINGDISNLKAVFNIGKNASIDKFAAFERSSGVLRYGENSSCVINLNGKINAWLGMHDYKNTENAGYGKMTINLCEDFDITECFTKGGSDSNPVSDGVYFGFSSDTVFSGEYLKTGVTRIVAAPSVYDSVKASTRIRDIEIIRGVYLSDAGDNSDGSTPDKAFASIHSAYNALGDEGGAIIISGTFTASGANITPNAHLGVVTVMGADENAVFTNASSSPRYYLGGDTVFKNIHFLIDKVAFSIVCDYNDLTIDETVTMEKTKETFIIAGIFGKTDDYYDNNPSGVVVTINAGTWSEVDGLIMRGVTSTNGTMTAADYAGCNVVYNIGGTAVIGKLAAFSRSYTGPMLVDATCTVNLNGGVITTWMGQSESTKNAHGYKTFIVNIGKDFVMADSFTSNASGTFCGISAGTVMTTPTTVDTAKLFIAPELYQSLKESDKIRGFEVFNDVVELSGYTVTLGGNIGVNFYTKLDASVLADESAIMRFTLPDGTQVDVPVKDITLDENGYYKFSCAVAAKNMVDDITAQIITSVGATDTYTYTVVKYAEYIIANSADFSEESVALAKALLNYGATAQIKFNYKTDELANASLADSGENVVADVDAATLADYAQQATAKIDGVKFLGSTAVWETTTNIRLYFSVDSGADITFTLGEKVLTPVQIEDICYVEIVGIYAQEMDDTYVLTVSNGSDTQTVSYSVYSYIYGILTTSSNQAMIDAVEGAYWYSQAAIAFEATKA